MTKRRCAGNDDLMADTWPPGPEILAGLFDERAASYDESLMHRWVAGRTAREVERLPEGAVVLDAAAGTGLAAAALIEREPGVRVVAVDLSWGLLDVARRRAGVASVRGDVAALPLVDAVVDVVVCVSAAAYFRDPDSVLAEFARVLRPGGELVLQVWERDGLALPAALRAATRAVGVHVEDPNARLGTGADLVTALRAAAFAPDEVARDVWRQPWPDPHEAWAGLLQGPTGHPLRSSDSQILTAARAHFLSVVEAAARRRGQDEHKLMIVRAERR